MYESLLRLGPSTGYAVAKASTLARANAYQALDALVRRGAARRSATTPARYTPQAPDVLILDLERLFRRDLDALRHALRSLPRQTRGALPLIAHDNWEAFTTAAAAAIGASHGDVLALSGPWAPNVQHALAAPPAGTRVRAVEPTDRAAWPGLPVAVLVDGTLAFSGVVGEDGVGAGIESASPALVPFVHHLLLRETA